MLENNNSNLISANDFFENGESVSSSHIGKVDLHIAPTFYGSGAYMNLQLQPTSDDARLLIADLTQRIRKSNSGPVRQLETALGAVVADLLAASEPDADGYGYRLTGTKTFTGKRIGWKPFMRATDGLEELGYLHKKVGKRSSATGAPTGTASRFKLTPAFLDHAAKGGIARETVWDHFGFSLPPSKVKKPIVIKSYSVKNYYQQTKTAGRSMAVDYALPEVQGAAKFVQDYNTFIGSFRLNFDHVGFHRIFNNGDKPRFNLDEGGRLYAIGGSFQSWPQRNADPTKPDRAGITIDGHRTSEIDIGASHYTIAASRTGLSFDTSQDPYNVSGYPRLIVKAWVNASLGNGRQLTKWPAHLKKAYAKAYQPNKPNRFRHGLPGTGFPYTGDLQRDYPIAKIKANLAPLFPVIDNVEGLHIEWGEFQYRESCIIIATLDDLMRNYGIPALPVHDSLICREHDQEIVRERLSYWFHNHTNIMPRLSAK